MADRLDLGEIAVDVTFKNIKNVHLSVYPPAGHVRISAPIRMSLNTVRVFAISKLGWIKQQQRKIVAQDRETPREYLDLESHYLWGKRYLLRVIEGNPSSTIEVQHSKLLLRVPPKTTEEKKQDIVARWYRGQLKAAVPSVIARWSSGAGRNGRGLLCAADEDQVGKLQSSRWDDSPQHRIGKKAE